MTNEQKLERMNNDPDLPCFVGVINYIRSVAPRSAKTHELSTVCLSHGKTRKAVYGIVSKARKYLDLTTGECIPSARGAGYRISKEVRPRLFESIKSGNRADGHLAREIANFNMVRRDQVKTTEDLELFLYQQSRVVFAQARLAISNNAQHPLSRVKNNERLLSAARAESRTPWKEMGLTDPDDTEGENDD